MPHTGTSRPSLRLEVELLDAGRRGARATEEPLRVRVRIRSSSSSQPALSLTWAMASALRPWSWGVKAPLRSLTVVEGPLCSLLKVAVPPRSLPVVAVAVLVAVLVAVPLRYM